jgi:hypothetical protein
MKEILPAVFHWTTRHPKIGIEVSSYFLAEERVLIDPLVPAEGLDGFDTPPAHILLTNRHHYRDSAEFEQRFRCPVWCVESGMHEFTHGETVRAFAFGDTLPGGITAFEIGAICPDDTALLIPRAGGIVALADGLVRQGEGPLGFVPDAYMGDDPESVKQELRASLRRLAEREFDHILLAHGWPWIGGARQALIDFAGE